MLFVIFSIVICGVIATPIASTHHNQRIVGGFDAVAGQFPYQVSIRFALIGMHLCGGSVISNRWILSSALCTGGPIWVMRAVVGSIYLNSGGVTHLIVSAVRHPEYDVLLPMVKDIGLLKVFGEIRYSDLVKPVKLPSSSSSSGLPLTVSGWGTTNIGNANRSNTLQFVTLNTIDVRDCQEWFPNIPLDDTHICTYSNSGQGICMVDSGNPLVFERVGEQHAIASFTGLCGNGYPDLHTKVASFRDWIKQITNV